MNQVLTCLLVDDDEDDRDIFALALGSVNKVHKCLTAVNGKDALQKLEADPAFVPDFIFLDLNMPVMNGKQCLVEIKKNPRLSSVPVIVYTTSSYQKDVEELTSLGANHFLTKPSRLDVLVDSLSQLLTGNRPVLQ